MTGLNIKQAALDAFEGSASAQQKISPSEHKKTLIAQLKKWSDPKSVEFLSGFRHEEFISLDFKKTIQTAKVFRKQFKRLLVLGTGGSSLGSKAILQALKQKCDREIIFIENLDCNEIPNLKSSDLKQTGVIAISKSGSTLETLLALSYFEKLYKKNSLKISKHFAAISDAHASADLSTQNMLRSWATVRGCTILDMHPSIGGRWSVSTAVGIFPLAFAGLNSQKFLSALCKSFKRAATGVALLTIAPAFAADEAVSIDLSTAVTGFYCFFTTPYLGSQVSLQKLSPVEGSVAPIDSP